MTHFRLLRKVFEWSYVIMRKTLWKVGLSTAALVLLSSSSAYAQTTANALLTVNVTVASRARLTLNPTSISFADQDPDLVPIMTSATPVTVSVGARTATASNVTLTLMGPDFAGGGNTIGIGNLSWTAPAAGFVDGTAATTATPVGSWTGPGARTGDQTYSLVNSWAYVPGTYSDDADLHAGCSLSCFLAFASDLAGAEPDRLRSGSGRSGPSW